jgi:hypothetical protein
MKYINASDVLPEELIKEIQKYAAGKLLYIPSGEEKRAWGESSGYRTQLKKRNRMIRTKYAHGRTVSELADEYYLSLDSIKKIIYSKQNDVQLAYSATLESAVSYANSGMLEEWIQCYLLLTLQASPDEQELLGEDDLYFGVVKFPLRLIQHEEFDNVENVASESESDGKSMSLPLLIQYREGTFHCMMQEELLASLKQRKVNAYPSIIVLKENAGYKRFMKHFGNVFIFVDKV